MVAIQRLSAQAVIADKVLPQATSLELFRVEVDADCAGAMANVNRDVVPNTWICADLVLRPAERLVFSVIDGGMLPTRRIPADGNAPGNRPVIDGW